MATTLETPVVFSGTAAECIQALNGELAQRLRIRFRWFSECPDQDTPLSSMAAQLVRRFVLATWRRACSPSVVNVTFIERAESLTVVSTYVANTWAPQTLEKDFDFPETLRTLGGMVSLKRNQWDEEVSMTIPRRA